MATAERRAEVVWNGDLQSGSGTFDLASSGAWSGANVSFATRTENPNGNTSPEELIAAAHASCYAMALSNVLHEGGNDPEELRINATCVLDMGSLKITTETLDVRGRVPGLDADGFQQAVEQADQVCPVTNALRGNVDVRVNATLD
ncbi:OsmC family peroxiredoxin [Rubrobacter tropicus]|uniref:OsmC family peroxiredoxin n=1 Tax=Rubrobacter tropicus TaxID=2653851 RepID=A0A6G8QE71_9ACTN|nr:OsmC family peroxiredoxin [Rubrobacter tropicus]QIN84800.1 OsmC family peroxiredoxin [Rubrobacter tropicus]